jgi:16S rRNA (guanine527-N7)-methyltransferase
MGISMQDSRYSELARMIEAWPGLVSGPATPLVADSLVLLPFLGEARRVVDVGSGGGLPGLPLKIARPELEVTLIESDQAKAAFLVQAAARLGLRGVEVLAVRAEEAGRDARHREAYDVAVARAVAALPALVELCLPLVRVGGRLLAQKTSGDEVAAAARALEMLGGEVVGVEAAASSARDKGVVVIVAKVRPTPDAYPRRSGIPAARPL